MAMTIRTNVASLNAQKNLSMNSSSLESSLARLSSGFRITKAGDDAAGLGISVNLQAQIRSYNQASRNAADGVSMVQTAEAALNETSNILTRLRELAMQSASSGVGVDERAYIQLETTALTSEIERIAQATEYNGTHLLNASETNPLSYQIGIRDDAAVDRIEVDMSTIDTTLTGLTLTGLDLSDQTAAQGALSTIDDAIQVVSEARATFGAFGNRLSSVANTIQTASESLSAANSRIRDVDVAEETSALARGQVLQQAGVSVLAQANQMPQLALKLLG